MSALIIAARARKDSREERRWTLLSLLFLNSKGPFFFSLSFYLLKPLTSLEEAILHPSEREQKWYRSHFQEHPPGDLLRSQCFLGHHFLLFFALLSLWLLLTDFSALFFYLFLKCQCSSRLCERPFSVYPNTHPHPWLHPLPYVDDSQRYISRSASPWAPDPHTQLPTGYPLLDGLGSSQPSMSQTYLFIFFF